MDDLLNDLKSDEGWRASIYDDATGEPISKGSVVVGFPTIGYGFMVDASRGGELPKSVADMWLMYAVMQRWNKLVSQIPWILEQPLEVQRALGNMSYQIGVDGLLNFKYMLAALQRSDRVGAAEHAFNSRWSIQTPARAQRIAALIRGIA
jgi:lysozyme